jgi:hypothetical protein
MNYKYMILQELHKPLGYPITMKIMYDELYQKYIFIEPGFYISWKKNDNIPKFIKLKLSKNNFIKLKKFISACELSSYNIQIYDNNYEE